MPVHTMLTSLRSLHLFGTVKAAYENNFILYFRKWIYSLLWIYAFCFRLQLQNYNFESPLHIRVITDILSTLSFGKSCRERRRPINSLLLVTMAIVYFPNKTLKLAYNKLRTGGTYFSEFLFDICCADWWGCFRSFFSFLSSEWSSLMLQVPPMLESL